MTSDILKVSFYDGEYAIINGRRHKRIGHDYSTARRSGLRSTFLTRTHAVKIGYQNESEVEQYKRIVAKGIEKFFIALVASGLVEYTPPVDNYGIFELPWVAQRRFPGSCIMMESMMRYAGGAAELNARWREVAAAGAQIGLFDLSYSSGGQPHNWGVRRNGTPFIYDFAQ